MNRKFFYLAILFAILSSLRTPFLPEFQLLLIISSVFLYRKINKNVIYLIITILCTHHYVIPDFLYRFNSSEYPSFYTKTIFSVKILDIFTICFLLFSIPKFSKFAIFFKIGIFPYTLLILALLGGLFLNREQIDTSMALFLFRSIILTYLFFINTVSFKKEELIQLSKLAILAWTAKMLFSIIFPHAHPLARSIFGYEGIIYFAGDEFSTIGAYYCIILLFADIENINFRKMNYSILFIFALTLIAQRKGAVPYFILLFLLVYIEKTNNLHLNRIYNFGLILYEWFVFLFILIFVLYLQSPLLKLAFSEYTGLTTSALDSIKNIFHEQPINGFLGYSPWGKYRVINLNPIFDHEMSFGKEVGQVYRYAIWGLPYGRSLINIGLVGFIILMLNLFRNVRKWDSKVFYLYIFCLPFFMYAVITPVISIALGISLSSLYIFKKNRYNNGNNT